VPAHGSPGSTTKGEAGAARLLEAATRVLARDGVGRASVGRIADEAGMAKRMIAYYFGSRDGLLTRVVQRIGERIAGNLTEAAEDDASPEDAASAWVDALWSAVTAEPALVPAYFALTGGQRVGATSEALDELDALYVSLIRNFVLDHHPHARELSDVDLDTASEFIFAILRGMLLKWVIQGDGPMLERHVAQLKEVLVSTPLLAPSAATAD
jgi:AcrR family transcriptional regulator